MRLGDDIDACILLGASLLLGSLQAVCRLREFPCPLPFWRHASSYVGTHITQGNFPAARMWHISQSCCKSTHKGCGSHHEGQCGGSKVRNVCPQVQRVDQTTNPLFPACVVLHKQHLTPSMTARRPCFRIQHGLNLVQGPSVSGL